MAVTGYLYGQASLNIGKAKFDFTADTFKMMLTTSSYSPNIDTHDFKNDVTNEVTGTNYTAGGVALSGLTWTYDSTNNRSVLDANDVTFSNVTLTARYGVVYKDTGTSSTSPLLLYVDFGSDQSPAGVDLIVPWSSNGILRAILV